MRLTRRGWAVVALALAGTGLAYGFGPRSLGAVVVPAVVALVAAVLQVRYVPEPTVTRSLPGDAPVGEEGEVTLRFGVDEPFPATVRDAVPRGLTPLGDPTTEAVVGADPVRYAVRYARRGRWEVGPVDVRHTDVLGLVARTRRCGDATALLVYPPVHDLPTNVVSRLRVAFADDSRTQRDEFEGLREYVRGDALRDVDWKSSAKRDDLIVTEFAGARPEAAVTVALGAAEGDADDMAAAGASVVTALLRADVRVTLRTPDGEMTAGPEDRDAVLAHLARTGAGSVPRGDADVVVDARGSRTVVRIHGEKTTFGRLRDGRADLGGVEEVAA
ncbi:MAG: DUF58 domain-containing protein [Haloferacaceae archaeon]